MSRERFHFDPDALRFEPHKPTLKARLARCALYALLAVTLSLLIRYSTQHYLPNLKETKLLADKETILGQYRTIEERIQELEAILLDIQHWDDHIYRTFFELEPIPLSIREAGLGGAERYNNLLGYENAALMMDLNKRADMTGIRMDIQSRSLGDLLAQAERHGNLMIHKPSIQPISLEDYYWISSVFGYRTDPIDQRRAMHRGLDFAGAIGTPVYATGEGVVKETRIAGNGYGKEVIIDHGFGYTTRYGHLDEILVHVGQKIKRGNIIGTLGDSGKSTGPHLHYEVCKDGMAENPKHYYAEDLSPSEYSEVVNQ